MKWSYINHFLSLTQLRRYTQEIGAFKIGGEGNG